MTITVRSILQFYIEMDMSYMAHSIFWAVSQQLVRLDDGDHVLDGVPYDSVQIQKITDDNMLGIGRIKLYVIESAAENWFAFYLAENPLDANRLHTELFKEYGRKITRADRLMLPDMLFAESGTEENLYDYKKRIPVYPAYAGHAKAGERVLYAKVSL